MEGEERERCILFMLMTKDMFTYPYIAWIIYGDSILGEVNIFEIHEVRGSRFS